MAVNVCKEHGCRHSRRGTCDAVVDSYYYCTNCGPVDGKQVVIHMVKGRVCTVCGRKVYIKSIECGLPLEE